MGTFRKPLTLALLKLKLKCPSSSYSKRKAKYKRNANVDSEHFKKRTKCKRNGPNVTQIQCLARGSQRAKQRTTLHFETLEEAAARVGKRKRQEDPRVRKKKRHSPPSHQVNFDKENLLENQGVDLKRFQQLRRSDHPLPRRRLNRMVGRDITVPYTSTPECHQTQHKHPAVRKNSLTE